MRMKRMTIDRREFLKRGATLGVGTVIAPAFLRCGWAASKDRVVIFQGVGLDSLHPYAYSGGGIVGIWLHMIEPLVQMDFGRNEYVGVLAESWESRQEMGIPPEERHPLSHGITLYLEGCGVFLK